MNVEVAFDGSTEITLGKQGGGKEAGKGEDLKAGMQACVWMVVPGKPRKPLPAPTKASPTPNAWSTLQNARPGDYILLSLTGDLGKSVVTAASPYDMKPGEDEPNVYFYVDKGQEKVGNDFRKTVTVSRFAENSTFYVPLVDGTPNALMMQVIDAATTDTMLEIKAAPGKIREITSIKVFEPPRPMTFVQMTTQRKMQAVQVKDGDKTLTIPIRPKAGDTLSLTKKAQDLKPDQAIMVRTVTDDDGTWLADIKTQAKDSTTKPGPTSAP